MGRSRGRRRGNGSKGSCVLTSKKDLSICVLCMLFVLGNDVFCGATRRPPCSDAFAARSGDL